MTTAFKAISLLTSSDASTANIAHPSSVNPSGVHCTVCKVVSLRADGKLGASAVRGMRQSAGQLLLQRIRRIAPVETVGCGRGVPPPPRLAVDLSKMDYNLVSDTRELSQSRCLLLIYDSASPSSTEPGTAITVVPTGRILRSIPHKVQGTQQSGGVELRWDGCDCSLLAYPNPNHSQHCDDPA